jgi:hypothetical protein
VRPPAEVPRLFLGARSLTGVSLATRDRLLDVVARYREHETLAVTISKAIDAGAGGVIACAVPVVCEALRELKRNVPMHVVIPALTEHERHGLEPGIEPLLARRRRSGLGLASLSGSAAFGRGDLIARLPVLIESELARVPPRDVRGLVLDAWLTDLALAAGHQRFFESWGRIAHRFRAMAGLETHNLGLLLRRLREWKVQPDYVVGPINPHGLLAKPSPAETWDEIARAAVPVIAKELRAGGVVPLSQAARFAVERGAYGLAPDLTEIEEMAGDLSRCAAALPSGVTDRAG